MDMLLVKIFATALTLSQVTTAPDALQTHFDRDADQGKVVALLRDGCTHMRKVFEIEDINLDDLLTTALEDPDSIVGGNGAFRGIKFADLQSAYRQFCTDEPVPNWGFDAGAVTGYPAHQGDVVCGGPAGGEAGAGLEEVGSGGEGDLGGAQLFFKGEEAGLEDDFDDGSGGVGQLDDAADVLADGLEVGGLPGLEETDVEDHVEIVRTVFKDAGGLIAFGA